MSVSLKEIAKEEKVPYSTLAGWIERELIEPSHRTGKSEPQWFSTTRTSSS